MNKKILLITLTLSSIPFKTEGAIYVNRSLPIAKTLYNTCKEALRYTENQIKEEVNYQRQIRSEAICYSYLEGYKDAFHSPAIIRNEIYCIDFKKGREHEPNGLNGYFIAKAFVGYFKNRQDELTTTLETALPKALSHKLKCE